MTNIQIDQLKEGQRVMILVKAWLVAKKYWPSDMIDGTVLEIREKAILVRGRVGGHDLPEDSPLLAGIFIPKSAIVGIWLKEKSPAGATARQDNDNK